MSTIRFWGTGGFPAKMVAWCVPDLANSGTAMICHRNTGNDIIIIMLEETTRHHLLFLMMTRLGTIFVASGQSRRRRYAQQGRCGHFHNEDTEQNIYNATMKELRNPSTAAAAARSMSVRATADTGEDGRPPAPRPHTHDAVVSGPVAHRRRRKLHQITSTRMWLSPPP